MTGLAVLIESAFQQWFISYRGKPWGFLRDAFEAGWEARAKHDAKIAIDVLHLDEHGPAGE